MTELPEAEVLSSQIETTLTGRRVAEVTVLQSPHKFAWFLGEPETYPGRLRHKTVTGAESHGGMVQVRLGETSLVLHEGPPLRYLTDPANIPEKHQLLVGFTDSSFLSVSIQMYGGIICFERDEWDNEYYHAAWIRFSVGMLASADGALAMCTRTRRHQLGIWWEQFAKRSPRYVHRGDRRREFSKRRWRPVLPCRPGNGRPSLASG